MIAQHVNCNRMGLRPLSRNTMKNVIATIDTTDGVKELIIFGSTKSSIEDHEEFLIGWKHGYQAGNPNKLFNKISFRIEDQE